MKKIVSLGLAGLMLVSMIPTAFAAEVTDTWTQDTNADEYILGTLVVYGDDADEINGGTGAEAYTVTVPASMNPGGSAKVTATGAWASNRKLVVTASESVTLGCDISTDKKTLNVTFAGIEAAGSNIAEMDVEAAIAVEGWADADQNNIAAPLFGEWSGTITYEAGIVDVA